MLDVYDVRYKDLRLIPSKSAAYEMFRLGMDLVDCKRILEDGYSPRKRAKDTEEKWINVGNKSYNVVITRSFNHLFNEDVWIIKHVGRFTKRKW